MRHLLEDAVGGAKALDNLDTKPLPDEEFVWRNVAEDIRERVGEVLSMCDSCCDEMLDVEYRTACRRLLARVATGNPRVFRRKARADTAAAALCYAVGKANDLFSASGERMRVKDLLGYFGLSQAGVSQRAETLLNAAGIAAYDRYGVGRYGDMSLASPALLVSSRRRSIVDLRDGLTL